MHYLTGRSILISSLFVFSVIAAVCCHTGNITSFVADNQFNWDNHFGMTKIGEDGNTVFSYATLGGGVVALAWGLLLLIWKRINDDTLTLQMLWTAILVVVTLTFLKIVDWNPVYWLAIHIPVFPPFAWLAYGFLLTLLMIPTDGLFGKVTIPLALLAAVLIGDLVHGWFGHVTTHGIVALLSLALHTMAMLSYMAWLLVGCTIVTLIGLMVFAAGLAVIVLALSLLIVSVSGIWGLFMGEPLGYAGMALFFVVCVLLSLFCKNELFDDERIYGPPGYAYVR